MGHIFIHASCVKVPPALRAASIKPFSSSGLHCQYKLVISRPEQKQRFKSALFSATEDKNILSCKMNQINWLGLVCVMCQKVNFMKKICQNC